MLRELRIGNLALADDLVIPLGVGLTMLTGETGAGKSLIAGALSLLAGTKADRQTIREGEDLAFVEGVFDLTEAGSVKELAGSLGVRIGQDDLLVLRREIKREGRGRVLINGLVSSLALLEQLGERLVAVQSQDQQRLLARPAFPGVFLDEVLNLETMLADVASAKDVFEASREELAERRREAEFAREQLEIWAYQHRELDEANLDPDEERDLAERLSLGRNARALLEAAGSARENLVEGPVNARDLLGRSESGLEPLVVGSDRLEEILGLLRDASAAVSEAASGLERFVDRFDADPSRLDEMEARKALYEDLRRKYGTDVPGLIARRDDLAKRLTRQEDAAGELAALEEQVSENLTTLQAAALALREARCQGAPEVGRRAEELIRPLDLPEMEIAFTVEPDTAADGGVELEGRPCRMTARGADRVGLIVRPNPGEAAAEVGKVASGGEKSRIYLGLSVLAMGEASRPLLLFDEIDAGLGMEGALPVARLLARLADGGQILCITHLPTVAARGDAHLRVRKSVADGRTSVAVQTLAGDERVAEIARLLGGEASGAADGGQSRRAYARQLLAGDLSAAESA